MLTHRAALLLLLCLCFGCVLWNGFCGDDHFLFVNNSFYRNPSNIVRIFRPGYNVSPEAVQYGYAADKGTGSVGYRPVTTASFFLDSFFWKDIPAGYHLTSLLWHAANVVLVYEVALVLASPQVAFVAALIFAIHPVNTEAVAAIGYRSDLLACFFLLTALLAWLLYRQKGTWGWAAASCGAYGLALFSKETALLFPCLLLIVDGVNFPAVSKKGRGQRYLPFLLTAVFYLYIYYGVFPNTALPYVPRMGNGVAEYASIFIQILALYLKEIFFVFSAGIMPALYWPLPRPLLSSDLIFQGLLAAGAGGLLLVIILRWAVCAWAALWGVVFFLPVFVFWVNPNPIALRYVYVPFAGVAFLAARGLVHVWARWKDRLTLPMRVFLCFSGIVSLGLPAVSSNLVWKNNLSVGDAWVKGYPEHYMGYGFKGTEFFRFGRYDDAAQSLALARKDPRCDNLLFDYQLGFSYLALGKNDQAKTVFEGIIRKAPFFDKGYLGMGEYYYLGKQYALAIPYLERALVSYYTDDNARHLLQSLSNIEGASGVARGLDMVGRILGDGPRFEKVREFAGGLAQSRS